jgi:DNA-binding GntR family transcriptional regulator
VAVQGQAGAAAAGGERGSYRRIGQELIRRIRSREWLPGTMLPSEAALKSEFGVARETIRQALSMVDAEGLVEVVPGRGRFILHKSGRREPTAAYERIAAELRAAVDRGDFGPDGALPTEAALMKEFGVSRGTVRRAIELLTFERLIAPRRGSGTYVTPPAEPDEGEDLDELRRRRLGEARPRDEGPSAS